MFSRTFIFFSPFIPTENNLLDDVYLSVTQMWPDLLSSSYFMWLHCKTSSSVWLKQGLKLSSVRSSETINLLFPFDKVYKATCMIDVHLFGCLETQNTDYRCNFCSHSSKCSFLASRRRYWGGCSSEYNFTGRKMQKCCWCPKECFHFIFLLSLNLLWCLINIETWSFLVAVLLGVR